MKRVCCQSGKADLVIAFSILLLGIVGLRWSLLNLPSAHDESVTLLSPLEVGKNYLRVNDSGSCLLEIPLTIEKSSTLSFYSEVLTELGKLTVSLSSNIVSQVLSGGVDLQSRAAHQYFHLTSVNPLLIEYTVARSAPVLERLEGPIEVKESQSGKLAFTVPRKTASRFLQIASDLAEQFSLTHDRLTFEVSKESIRCAPNEFNSGTFLKPAMNKPR
ncbi:MAG: hypothetical protein KDD64_11600 [Bdellovibrionales bacterium]|nr:hypothetical protein [Bdellovibrionales bacterium]